MNGTFTMDNSADSFASVRAGCQRLWVIVEESAQSSAYLFVDAEVQWFAAHGWPDITTKDWSQIHVVLMQPHPAESFATSRASA